MEHTVKVKICGITTAEDIKAVNQSGAELAGMVVFFPKSKRNLDIEKARTLLPLFDKRVKKCAVTVSPDAEQIRMINAAGFDHIQVHGPLSDEALAAAELPIIKAFNVTDIGELDHYSERKEIIGFVFDAAEYGSGKTFDWALLENIDIKGKLFILAGGLSPDNVARAVKALRPDCVDVSTGVENDNGIGKSKDKIFAFVKNAKSAL